MRQALSIRLKSHCRQVPPLARDANLHQPAGRDAGRGAGPYKGCRQEWDTGRNGLQEKMPTCTTHSSGEISQPN